MNLTWCCSVTVLVQVFVFQVALLLCVLLGLQGLVEGPLGWIGSHVLGSVAASLHLPLDMRFPLPPPLWGARPPRDLAARLLGGGLVMLVPVLHALLRRLEDLFDGARDGEGGGGGLLVSPAFCWPTTPTHAARMHMGRLQAPNHIEGHQSEQCSTKHHSVKHAVLSM